MGQSGEISHGSGGGYFEDFVLGARGELNETRFGKEVNLGELRRSIIHPMTVSGDVQERFFHRRTIFFRAIYVMSI